MKRLLSLHNALLLAATALALGGCQSANHAQQKADADAFAAKFFAALEKKPDVQVLPSGVMYQILKPGTGEFPTARDTAKVNYTGMLSDGTKFDSSRDRGEPANFPLGSLVPGMRDGLQKINRGGRIRIFIPYAQGYGADGTDAIPPYSILVFDVELLDFSPTPMSFF